MTILAALTTLYDRMKEAGETRDLFTRESISFELVIDWQGKPVTLADKRDHSGKSPRPVLIFVPFDLGASKRTSNTASNFLWDKSSYSLGVAKGEKDGPDGKYAVPVQTTKTKKHHVQFVKFNLEKTQGTEDASLLAFRMFLKNWDPNQFATLGFNTDALDGNIVFRIEEDTDSSGNWRLLHENPAVTELFQVVAEPEKGICLISGKESQIARIHPNIKGVQGAKTSGAPFVSFNESAYESLGKKQGDNAPVSQLAAFAYGTALNTLLVYDSGRNLRIGDATVVFWAETPKRAEAQSIEQMLSGAFNPPDDDAESNKLRAALDAVAKARAADATEFDPETRVYFLGLAPNAARLSVRFWQPVTFGEFARHITRFWDDLALAPSPWKTAPAAWSLLYETALQRKVENIPPRLGGDLMRAVLTGAPYPRTLLSGVINRMRADGDINGRRAAICRAVINRNTNRKEIPMSLDRDNPNPAYRLGRLFAVLERTQQNALPGLNATIRDRYFAAASATPARIFPQLTKNATHHLSLMRKGDSGGLAHWLDREMGDIWGGLEADLPRSLNLEDQGRFVAGYYHQRWTKKAEGGDASQDDVIETGSTEE